MVATGSAEQVTPVAGGISKGQGEVPKEQRQVLPEVIRVGILEFLFWFVFVITLDYLGLEEYENYCGCCNKKYRCSSCGNKVSSYLVN